MGLTAEQRLMATGIISPRIREDAAQVAWPESAAGSIRRWLRGNEVKPFRLPPERDSKRTYEKLERVLMPSEAEALVMGLDPADAAEFNAKLEGARTYLVAKYPMTQIDSVLGAEEMPLAFDEEERWLAEVAVLEDPERIVDELTMGSLEPAQAEAFHGALPELWQALYNIVADELTDMRESGRHDLPEDREAMVRILGLLPFEAPVMAKPTPPPAPPPTEKAPDLTAQQTPSERLTVSMK